MPASATPATSLLRRDGVAHELREYRLPDRHGRVRDDRPDYGLEAAAALGVEPARVCKTLIAVVDGRLVAAVLPVDRQLDLKALAAAAGGRHAELAQPAAAERVSGSVVGGISPIAPRRPMPVIIDRAVEAHPTVLVSAGRRGLQVELAPGDLVRVTGATTASIVRPR
jgi:Cys-tRNA(Pro)/Cys-tRNA(Cys) deacylase